MSADEDALRDALKAQNGFQVDDGSLFFGSGGTVDPVAAVDALREAGFALVQLPKPPPESHRWTDAEGNPDWDAYADAAHQALLDRLADHYWITIQDGLIYLPVDGTGDTPEQARELAAALLAAADAVDRAS